MKDERDLQGDVERARRAEIILKDPLIVNYFEEKRQTILHNLETSHWNNIEEQQELVRILRVLADFEKDFQKTIRTGVKAKNLLERILNKEK